MSGWWVALIGALVCAAFSVVPIDAIVDPRRVATRFSRVPVMLFMAGTVAVSLGMITVVRLLTT